MNKTKQKLEETIKLFFSDEGVVERLRIHYSNLEKEINDSDRYEPRLYLGGLTQYEKDVATGVLILNSLNMLDAETVEYLTSTTEAKKIKALVSYPEVLERVFRQNPNSHSRNKEALIQLAREREQQRKRASALAAFRRGDETFSQIMATILTKESFKIPRGLKMASVVLAGAVYFHLLHVAYMSSGEPLPDPPPLNGTGYEGPIPIMGPYGGTIPEDGGGPGVYTPPPQCWYDNGGKFTPELGDCPNPGDKELRAAMNQAMWEGGKKVLRGMYGVFRKTPTGWLFPDLPEEDLPSADQFANDTFFKKWGLTYVNRSARFSVGNPEWLFVHLSIPLKKILQKHPKVGGVADVHRQIWMGQVKTHVGGVQR